MKGIINTHSYIKASSNNVARKLKLGGLEMFFHYSNVLKIPLIVEKQNREGNFYLNIGDKKKEPLR